MVEKQIEKYNDYNIVLDTIKEWDDENETIVTRTMYKAYNIKESNIYNMFYHIMIVGGIVGSILLSLSSFHMIFFHIGVGVIIFSLGIVIIEIFYSLFKGNFIITGKTLNGIKRKIDFYNKKR